MKPIAQPLRPWIVFADDWGRHPSSCQHLVRPHLDRREVLWINTIGTRPPRLDLSTVRRVAGKLREWTRPRPATTPSETPAASTPRIIAPWMWPSFRSGWARSLNRRLLLRSLRPVFESLPQSPNVITTLPLVADLIGELPVHRWVYYCVDDFSVWPGYDGETMLRMEKDLVPRVDSAIAVSPTLQRHLAKLGRDSHLLTHGVDLDHFRSTGEGSSNPFAGLETPIVLFWGVIDRRMDTTFVEALSRQMTQGTIVLVGPTEDPDPALARLPRVVIRPPVSYSDLPGLARAAAVLVMPYIDAEVTRAMQPLKFKEYLATGRPVVVRRLPSTENWADAADLADTAEEFARLVIERASTKEPPATQQVGRERLLMEGWAGKAEQFQKWVDSSD